MITRVATLLLRKSTRFNDKNIRFTKKILDYKIKLTHSENTEKTHCNANHRRCTTHCKPETKKTGDSSNSLVAVLFRIRIFEEFFGSGAGLDIIFAQAGSGLFKTLRLEHFLFFHVLIFSCKNFLIT